MKIVKHNLFIATTIVLLIVTTVIAQTTQINISRIGSVKGIIERIESDDDGLYSIWFKVKGQSHEFMIREAKFIKCSSSDLEKGKYVQIKFKNREHSEMDDFFTAIAVEITILKQERQNASK